MSVFTPAQLSYLRLIFQAQLRDSSAWAPGVYSAGSFVVHGGELWVARRSRVTSAPNKVSGDWVHVGTVGGAGASLPGGTDGQTLVYDGNTESWVADFLLPQAADAGSLLYFQEGSWYPLSNLRWEGLVESGGTLTFAVADALPRPWDAPMPGIVFDQGPGAAVAGLFLNVEGDGSFQGGDAGNRLDLGWGGGGGGNFELYSKKHAGRPGQFRIIYGGDGPDVGHLQFTHYDGAAADKQWRVRAGLSAEGRFFCGYADTGWPGTADASELNDPADAPQYPFQVYNEDGEEPRVVMHVDKEGSMCLAFRAAPPVLDEDGSCLWVRAAAPHVWLTLRVDGVTKHYPLTLTEGTP